MDVEQKRQQILGTVRTIAIAAIELQPTERQAFIERAVAMIRRGYAKKQGPDPEVEDAWSHFLELTREMVKILEESGGNIGHA